MKWLHSPVIALVASFDTLLLFARAVRRRLVKLGFLSLFRCRFKRENDFEIIYLDVGTHREARELEWFVDKFLPRAPFRWRGYAFEACWEFFHAVHLKFASRSQISVLNKALCYPVPEGGKIRLYIDDDKGLSNSIFRESFGRYEEVDAISISAWIKKNNQDSDNKFIILRMNVEGAEKVIVEDLLDSGVCAKVVGYYGMWDDVYKTNRGIYNDFINKLKENIIDNFTFNGRDFKIPLRMNIICSRSDLV